MTVVVRVADLDEAPLVLEVMHAAYAEHKGVLPIDSGAHDETVEDVRAAMARGGAVLAFGDSGRAVGSARFKVEPDHLYVGRLAVLPSDRRGGVATAIMRFMDELGERSGRDSVRVEVRESLPSNVLLYEALGFEALRIEPHPRGPDRVLVMQKRRA